MERTAKGCFQKKLKISPAVFGVVDACVEFEADDEDEGVVINPEHDDDERSDGAVEFVVVSEIVDERSETDRGENAQE